MALRFQTWSKHLTQLEQIHMCSEHTRHAFLFTSGGDKGLSPRQQYRPIKAQSIPRTTVVNKPLQKFWYGKAKFICVCCTLKIFELQSKNEYETIVTKLCPVRLFKQENYLNNYSWVLPVKTNICC